MKHNYFHHNPVAKKRNYFFFAFYYAYDQINSSNFFILNLVLELHQQSYAVSVKSTIGKCVKIISFFLYKSFDLHILSMRYAFQ